MNNIDFGCVVSMILVSALLIARQRRKDVKEAAVLHDGRKGMKPAVPLCDLEQIPDQLAPAYFFDLHAASERGFQHVQYVRDARSVITLLDGLHGYVSDWLGSVGVHFHVLRSYMSSACLAVTGLTTHLTPSIGISGCSCISTEREISCVVSSVSVIALADTDIAPVVHDSAKAVCASALSEHFLA